MQISKKVLLTVLALSNVLSGCDQLYNKDMVSSVSSQVSNDFDTTQDALDRAKVPGKPINKDIVSVSDDIWLGDSSFVAEHNDPLPKRFEGEEGITLMTESEVSFDEITNQIFYLTGLSVQIEDSIKKDDLKDMSISYTGPLSGLLNMLSLKANVNWLYEDGNIVFYKFKTRTFVVHTLSTESSYTASISSGSDASATLATTAAIKEWTEMADVLKTIVKEGEVKMSPSTSSVTVTASPKTLQKVEAYIKEQNRRFVKQVAITVKVLQVSLSKDNNYGLNLSALFDNTYSLTTKTSNTAADGLSFAILEGGNTKWAGTKDNPTAAAIKALSTQGKTSLLTSAVVTARNNRVIPINNIQTFKYISSISTLTENTNSTTEVTPEEESVGFSMQLMPNILENGKLMLMFNMSLKELIEIENKVVGSTAVQLPKIAQRNFMQEIVMESGQTAVLTGFEKIQNTNSSEGLGNNDFTYVGGSQSTETSREVLVVMLTPQVITSPLDTEDNSNAEWGMPSY